ETARRILGEADLAAVRVGVEVDRNGKAAMRPTLGGVVAVRREMSTVFNRIAADDIALHAADVEPMDLQNFGRDATGHTRLDLLDHPGIGKFRGPCAACGQSRV